MLTQGCLLLNASLTASTDSSITTTNHRKFWTPVVHAVIEAILAAKENEEPYVKRISIRFC